jgi:hypothetical protein
LGRDAAALRAFEVTAFGDDAGVRLATVTGSLSLCESEYLVIASLSLPESE